MSLKKLIIVGAIAATGLCMIGCGKTEKTNNQSVEKVEITNDEYERAEDIEEEEDAEDLAEEVVPEKFSGEEVEVVIDKDKLQEGYEKFVEDINKLNEKSKWEFKDMYYSDVWNGNYSVHLFKGLEGKIDSVEKVRETDKYIIAKVVFDITNPAKTAFKEGKNDKYFCITKLWENPYYSDEKYAGFIINDPDEDIQLKYYENYEKVIHLNWPSNDNAGYGYRNKAIKYSTSMDTNKKISIDLDNDGREDSLSFEIMENNRSRYDRMYINKGEENEAVYRFDDEYLYSLNNRIIDIDKTDNYKEIVMEQDKDNWKYTIFRYDGKNIEKICDYQGYIEIDEDGNCIGYNLLDTESVYVNPDGKYLILDENTEEDYRDLTDKELKFVFEDQHGNYWYTEKKVYMKDIINDAIKEKK